MPDFIVIDELSNKINSSESNIKNTVNFANNYLSNKPIACKSEKGFRKRIIMNISDECVDIMTNPIGLSSGEASMHSVWDRRSNMIYVFGHSNGFNSNLSCSSYWNSGNRRAFSYANVTGTSGPSSGIRWTNAPYSITHSIFIPAEDGIYFIGGVQYPTDTSNVLTGVHKRVLKFWYSNRGWSEVGETNFPWMAGGSFTNATLVSNVYGNFGFHRYRNTTYNRKTPWYTINGKAYIIRSESTNLSNVHLYMCNTKSSNFHWKDLGLIPKKAEPINNESAGEYLKPLPQKGFFSTDQVDDGYLIEPQFMTEGPDESIIFVSAATNSRFNTNTVYIINTKTDRLQTINADSSNTELGWKTYCNSASNLIWINNTYLYGKANVSNTTEYGLYRFTNASLTKLKTVPSMKTSANPMVPVWTPGYGIYSWATVCSCTNIANYTSGLISNYGARITSLIPEEVEHIISSKEQRLVGSCTAFKPPQTQTTNIMIQPGMYKTLWSHTTFDLSLFDEASPYEKDPITTIYYD